MHTTNIGLRVLLLSFVVASSTGCLDDGEEGIDECGNCADGKQDTFAIADTSTLADGILMSVNTLSESDLVTRVKLTRRAAKNIVAARGAFDAANTERGRIQTLAALDAIPYVGTVAFARLRAFVEGEHLDNPCAMTPSIAGDVSIKTVQDVLALSGVRSITGTLTIDHSDRASLRGLDSIVCLGGLRITSNQHLSSLQGLGSLLRVTGDVAILDNPIGDYHALSLARIDGNLEVRSGWHTITNVIGPAGGFHALREVGGDANLDRFDSHYLRRIGGDMIYLSVSANVPIPKQIVDVPALATIGGALRVESGEADRMRLDSLREIGGTWTVKQMPWMTTISAPKLEAAAALVMVKYVRTIELPRLASLDSLEIDRPAYGMRASFPALEVVTGRIRVVDAAQVEFPVLTQAGYLIAEGESTHVRVPELVDVTHDVELTGASVAIGAAKLERIGGYLALIRSRPSTEHWPRLRAVGGQLRVVGDPSTANVASAIGVFDSLAEVGSLDVRSTQLTNLSAFPALSQIHGSAVIANNVDLVSLDGLESLRMVAGGITIAGGTLDHDYQPLASIAALRGITAMTGDVTFRHQLQLPYASVVDWTDELYLQHGWTGRLVWQ